MPSARLASMLPRRQQETTILPALLGVHVTSRPEPHQAMQPGAHAAHCIIDYSNIAFCDNRQRNSLTNMRGVPDAEMLAQDTV